MQLPGCGERLIAELGNWRGRRPSDIEWEILEGVPVPRVPSAWTRWLESHQASRLLLQGHPQSMDTLEENRWLRHHIDGKTYAQNFDARVDNSIYLPIIGGLLKLLP